MSLRATSVWIPSKDHAWVSAPVVSINAETDEVTVENPDNKGGPNLLFHQKDVPLVDESHLVLHDDLCCMNRLHAAPLLDILRRRYLEDKIYTTTSDMTLVSINPYKTIPGLYSNPLRFFDVPAPGEPMSKGAMPPHVFSVANGALYALINPLGSGEIGRSRFNNQSIVVSGESGAGKTEASKHVMTFLVAANLELVKRLESDDAVVDLQDIASRIELEVVGSNFVFEAFGNAKTVRNDNSSRFGKYIKLQYSDSNVLISAYTDTFLLEKSRILSVNPGESNYHVFYYLVQGLQHINAPLARDLHLAGATCEQFQILTDMKKVCHWKNRGEDENLESLMQAMSRVNFSQEEQVEIFRSLAGVLHMGNVTLAARDDDSNVVDLSCKTIPMSDLALLFGMSETLFNMKFTLRLVKIRGRSSVATKRLNEKEIRNNINAFIKMVYTGLFAYIVRKINYAHSHPDQAGLSPKKFIGILDIFGFEIFERNSFEQMCINFANERLQQHFNQHVFVSEKEEYAKQGLDSSFITYSDNQDVLDLICKKPSGLFCVLDDFAKVNKTSDAQLLINFHQLHTGPAGNSRYVKPRMNYQECFIINHFAGSVTYTSGEGPESFLSKNNDALEEGVCEGVLMSDNEFFRNISSYIIGNPMGTPGQLGHVDDIASTKFGEAESEETPSVGAKTAADEGESASLPAPPTGSSVHAMAASNTVSKRFNNQVNRLMSTLKVTEPHYIKCMKPNSKKAPNVFEGPLILEQLRYSGVLEVVRIRREGFPWSNTYGGFYREFEIFTLQKQRLGIYPPSTNCSEEKACEIAREICSEYLSQPNTSGENVGKELYAFGATRMYLREEGFNQLERQLNLLYDRSATRIQAQIRRLRAVLKLKVTQRMVVKLQAWARMKAKVTWKHSELARLAHLAALEAAREAARLQALEEERQLQLLQEQDRLRILAEKEAARIAAQIAAEEAEKERLRLIAEAIAADKKLLHDFTIATEQGDIAAMKIMLAKNPDLINRKSDEPGEPHRNPLQHACLGCSYASIKFLNPAPHEVHTRDAAGNNALLLVVSSANKCNAKDLMSVCQYLVRAACENFPLEDAFALTDYVSSRADKWATADTTTAAFNVGTEEERTKGIVLKEGWLGKMHNTYVFSASWSRRWVRLTDSALYYFRQSDDALPRDSVELTRATAQGMTLDFFDGPSGPAVKISFNSVQSGQKGRTSMSLMAADKVEMEQWARPLKAIMGMINDEAAVDGDLANNWQYTNPVSKKALVGAVTTKTRHNALHVLAGHDGRKDLSWNLEVAKVAAWLVCSGLDVEAKNSSSLTGQPAADGVTALQLACHNGNLALALALVSLGASLEGRMSTGSTLRLAVDGLGQDGMSTLAEATKRYLALPRALGPPPQLKKYTYLSMFFMSNSFSQNIPGWDDARFEPVLVISVVTRAHDLIEKAQVVSVPIAKSTGKEIWWGKTWHLQTPLDNTPNDGSVIIEVRSGADALSYKVLGWCYYRLKHSAQVTSSKPVLLQMNPWKNAKTPSVAELLDLSVSMQQECSKASSGDSMQVEVVCQKKN